MPVAAFATLGCKVNQYETQRILDSFEQRGFAIAPFGDLADVYVINTCSVTQTAERKSRQMLRRLARQNPQAIVVMTGCYAEMARLRGESVAEATLVVPNPEKLRALDHLLAAYPRLLDALAGAPPAGTRARPAGRTRATVKIQDGCDVCCAFCSIPYTRPNMRSRPADEVIAEVERFVSDGYREVVVTGVLVGSYGPATGSGGADLADLLARMAAVEGLERIRLSSIEPTHVTDRLLEAFMAAPALANHLHIPLQSGDGGVLRAMNRPYGREDYLGLCERVAASLPDAAITTDILVGFPGESRAAFDNTVGVVRRVGFARAHIFRYSPRPGTPAASMAHQVPEEEKEARAHELAAECRTAQAGYIGRYLGRTLPVLVEAKGGAGGLLSGYTENYIRVQFSGGTGMIGTMAPVRLLEPTQDGAVGEASASYQPEADIIPVALVSGVAAA